MSPEKRCPRCRSVIPPLASACVQCGVTAPADDDQRFNVVRKGKPFHPTANQPVQEGVHAAPPEAIRVQEGQRVWYCRIGGQIIGPVNTADIRDAFSKGQIDGNASVGIQGKKDWFPIRSLPQFADMITGIGRPPTSRNLPSPVSGGAALPSPQQPRQAPGPVRLPQPQGLSPRPLAAPPRGGPFPGLPQPGGPPLFSQRAAPLLGQPSAGPPADPDDATQVVPPLPPPTAIPSAKPKRAPDATLSPTTQRALQDEIAKLRRMVLVLGLLSGALLLAAATLLGLLVTG